MGCGRSHHRLPSQSQEEEGEDACEGEREKKGGKNSKKREGKKGTGMAGTNATTNGGTDEVKGKVERGGARKRREGMCGHDGQVGEPTGASPQTEVAVSKCSLPGFARAQLSCAHKPKSASRQTANFSLLNGDSCSETAAEDKMETETQNAAGRLQMQGVTTNPFHATTSQLEFFKMLDEKIEKGDDYNSDN